MGKIVISNLESLKSVGPFKEVKAMFIKDIKLHYGQNVNITIKSWQELLKTIESFCEKDLNSNLLFEIKNQYKSKYFKSKDSEYIYFLLKHTGKQQQEILGITLDLYRNKELAKKWRKELLFLVHPDHSKNEDAAKATKKLELLYKEMVN